MKQFFYFIKISLLFKRCSSLVPNPSNPWTPILKDIGLRTSIVVYCVMDFERKRI